MSEVGHSHGQSPPLPSNPPPINTLRRLTKNNFQNVSVSLRAYLAKWWLEMINWRTLCIYFQSAKCISNSPRMNHHVYTRCYSKDCQETHNSKQSTKSDLSQRSVPHIYPSPFANQWRIKDTINIDQNICDGTSSSGSSSHSSCSQCQQPIYHSSAKSEPTSNILRISS